MNQRAAIKNDILISIQPEYADQIMDGCKTVELRRRFVETLDQDTRLFIYSSNPAIDATFSLLARKCSEHRINIFIDSAIVDDVRHRDTRV
jgi:hypothetical protein